MYRARDTRFGRDIAIKVLPETLAKDIDRLCRFAASPSPAGILRSSCELKLTCCA
jgi:hypothetical protein